MIKPEHWSFIRSLLCVESESNWASILIFLDWDREVTGLKTLDAQELVSYVKSQTKDWSPTIKKRLFSYRYPHLLSLSASAYEYLWTPGGLNGNGTARRLTLRGDRPSLWFTYLGNKHPVWVSSQITKEDVEHLLDRAFSHARFTERLREKEFMREIEENLSRVRGLGYSNLRILNRRDAHAYLNHTRSGRAIFETEEGIHGMTRGLGRNYEYLSLTMSHDLHVAIDALPIKTLEGL